MDADDVAHPRRLAAQLASLRDEPRVDVLGCRVTTGGEAVGAGMRAYVEWVNGLHDHDAMARNRFVESPIVHPSVAGLRFAKLPEVLLEWRDSPARLTRRDARYSAQALFRRGMSDRVGARARRARPPGRWL
jgi:hypothetical protein